MDGTGLRSRPKRVDRSYQLEIFEKAKTQNVIACLPTGTGKTHIASLLIRHFANEVSANFTEGGKRIFFLVPQKVLVKQQADEIRENTAFSANEVRELSGNQNVDSWQQEKWNEILNSSKVVVMTAQILENMLKSGFIKTDQICLIIFDEIHHAAAKKKGKKTDHVYRRILDELRKGCSRPRLLGLTASIVNNKIDVDSLRDIIKDLEDQFLEGQCFTVSQDEVEQYKTNAKMVFWLTVKPGINKSLKERADILTKEVQEMIFYLDDCKKNKKRKISLPIDSDDLKKALRSIQKMLESMGIWMSQEIAGLFAKDLESTARDIEDFNPDYAVFLRQIAKYFMGFKDVVEQMLTGIDLKVQLLSLTEPKPKRLLQILENYSVQPETFKGIVFVEERLEAMLLSSFINKASVRIPSLKFVKASYLVGYNNRPGFIDKSVESAKQKQEQTMQSFRDGKYNLLVSTSVLEEGLDVPECNCIIRYHLPQIFRQWQQSKGRARAKNAHYYMIVKEEDFNDQRSILKGWVQMEDTLRNYCVEDKKKRNILAGNEYEDGDKQNCDDSIFKELVVKNEETGAVITHETAIGKVNAYLQHITSDAVLLAIDEFKEENGVYCTVKLPLNTVIHENVRGLVMSNRRNAKKAAYLKICQMLKERDALDKHLMPYSKKIKAEKIMKELALNRPDIPERDSKEEGPKPGSRKRKQLMEKKMSDYFKTDSRETPWFLYQIVLDDRDCNIKTGILVPKELPLDQLPSSFIIYKRFCPVEVRIHFVAQVSLTLEHLTMFINFHKYIFGTILVFPLRDILCDEEHFLDSLSQVIVVPVDDIKKRVDVDFIDEVARRLNDPLFKFPTSYSDYENFLVTPNYRENYRPVKVKKVLFDKNPFSKFDDPKIANNYVEYYKNKYDIELKDKKQPLLQVEYCEKLSGLLAKKAKHMVVHLIPELVDRNPIEASLYEDLSCFPALLYRLNQLLLADSFRRRTCREVNLGQEEVPAGFFKQLTFPSIKMIEKTRSQKRDDETREDRIVVLEDNLADFGRAWNEDEIYEMSVHNTDDENTSSSSSDNAESEEEQDSDREEEKNQNSEATVNDSNMMYDPITKQWVPKFDELGRLRLSTAFGGWDPMRMKLDMLEKAEAKKPEIVKANQHSFLIEFNSDILSDSSPSDSVPIPSPDNDKMTAAKNCFKEAMKKLEEMEDGQFNVVEGEIKDNFLKGSTTDEEAFSLIKSFDKTASVTLFSSHGIPPSLYIEVFSASSAYDLVNSERLETLGDSFLKWCISDFLYSKTAKFPEVMEGHLTEIKKQLVSNFNLYRLAVEKELDREIITHHFMAPRYNWMPPGFVLNRNNETEEQSDQHPKEKQLVSDKKIADSMEALIGAIILCRGIRDAAKFIQWLGLASLGVTDESGDGHHWLPQELALHPNVSDTEETREQLNVLFERSNLKQCEEILNYSFQDKAFLVKAITHPSNYDNRITGGNQKLEFLGDAVLDFLITRYIFEVKKEEEKEGKKSIVFFGPGQLTDLRSALVNNAFLGMTLVKYQLHKYLSHYSGDISKNIKLFYQRYRDAVKDGPLVTCGPYIVVSKDSDSSSENSGESNSSDEQLGFIEPPKILGDLFESILGAIYLDSNRDMDVVWKVVYGLIKEDIARFIDKIPINPVRKVHEEDAKVKFTKKSKDKATNKSEVQLVFKGTTFIGRGRNGKLAKISAYIQGLERFNLFA